MNDYLWSLNRLLYYYLFSIWYLWCARNNVLHGLDANGENHTRTHNSAYEIQTTLCYETAHFAFVGMCGVVRWYFIQFSAVAKSGIIAELQRSDPLHLMSARQRTFSPFCPLRLRRYALWLISRAPNGTTKIATSKIKLWIDRKFGSMKRCLPH